MSLNAFAADPGKLSAYPTADGSFSLESERFGEAFHNSAGALNEALAKFANQQNSHALVRDTVSRFSMCAWDSATTPQ